jgi:uracil phosphoribosyltransferase
VDRLKEAGTKAIRIVCLLATPQAVENLRGHHPDVHIWTAAIDNEITENGYIRPGLGDVGDRIYGTR